MTPREIADRFLAGANTPERLRKLKALCGREKMDLARVLVLLPDEDQQTIAGYDNA